METGRKKGFFTFRTAAVLLLASAVLELLGATSAVPLFGEVRGGATAVVYHLIYVGLFVGLGVGLWTAARWGYTLVFVTAVVYTLDKSQLVLSPATVEQYLRATLTGMESQLRAQGIDFPVLVQGVMLLSVVVVLCWWGFALYAYWRRAYFQLGPQAPG